MSGKVIKLVMKISVLYPINNIKNDKSTRDNNMNKEELNKILENHKIWLKGDGNKANLIFADLEGANLENTRFDKFIIQV